MKVWIKDFAYEIEQQRVNDESEQSQGENQQGQREKQQKRTDDGVEDTEHQRGHGQIQRPFVVDAADEIDGNQHCQSVYDPALKETFHAKGNLEGHRPKRKSAFSWG